MLSILCHWLECRIYENLLECALTVNLSYLRPVRSTRTQLDRESSFIAGTTFPIQLPPSVSLLYQTRICMWAATLSVPNQNLTTRCQLRAKFGVFCRCCSRSQVVRELSCQYPSTDLFTSYDINLCVKFHWQYICLAILSK